VLSDEFDLSVVSVDGTILQAHAKRPPGRKKGLLRPYEGIGSSGAHVPATFRAPQKHARTCSGVPPKAKHPPAVPPPGNGVLLGRLIWAALGPVLKHIRAPILLPVGQEVVLKALVSVCTASSYCVFAVNGVRVWRVRLGITAEAFAIVAIKLLETPPLRSALRIAK